MKPTPYTIILLLHFSIYFNFCDSVYEQWPAFYGSGESTHPTQSIYNNLTHYRDKWEQVKLESDFGETYSMTFAWDCTTCDQCFKANKYILVENDIIIQLETSKLNDQSKIIACASNNNTNKIEQYKTIDQLYTILIEWVEKGMIDSTDYLIMELMLNPIYYFPSNVKLSASASYIAWDILCFEPKDEEDEDVTCDYDPEQENDDKQYEFWVTKEMQTLLGWSMVFLILVACSLGYCINWLKKKKTEKIEAWREKEQRARDEKKKMREREKERKLKIKQQQKKQRHRRLSKSKHHKKQNMSSKPMYSNIDNSDHDDDRSDDDDVHDIEEQKHDDAN